MSNLAFCSLHAQLYDDVILFYDFCGAQKEKLSRGS